MDLLRAIAIVEVVLAHSDLPGWLFQTRNFGVPLLMLLSGWSISLATQRQSPTLINYAKHRMRRLVVPTWLFLSVYFVSFMILDAYGVTSKHYSIWHVVNSFNFGTGIDYIWVIRVNLLISLITPALIGLMRRTDRSFFLVICFGAAAISNVLWLGFNIRLARDLLGPAHEVLKSTVFYLLGYGSIFGIGLVLPQMPTRAVLRCALACGAVFAAMAVWFLARTGHFVPTQLHKYPPQIYYLSYAMFVSLLLVSYRHEMTRLVRNDTLREVIRFLGANTLWIYLWHIVVIEIVHAFTAKGYWPDHYLAAWVGITTGAALLTWIQAHAMDMLASATRSATQAMAPIWTSAGLTRSGPKP